MNRPNTLTETVLRDLQKDYTKTKAGIDLLSNCGCTDDFAAISEGELMALGQQTDLQQLMASPQLLACWNALRMRVV